MAPCRRLKSRRHGGPQHEDEQEGRIDQAHADADASADQSKHRLSRGLRIIRVLEKRLEHEYRIDRRGQNAHANAVNRVGNRECARPRRQAQQADARHEQGGAAQQAQRNAKL